jgi:hypothetical protein
VTMMIGQEGRFLGQEQAPSGTSLAVAHGRRSSSGEQ